MAGIGAKSRPDWARKAADLFFGGGLRAETVSQTQSRPNKELAIFLGKSGNLCYTQTNRQIEPRLAAAERGETNVAERDSDSLRTTGGGGGEFFYLNRS